MTTDLQTWPAKEGEFANMVMDSTRWNGFVIRDDDIIVATHPKSGTTLTQQILLQILFGPDPALLATPHVSPWIDMRHGPFREVAEAQTRRRILKTHLARLHLPLSSKAKYVVVARDVRDVAWSFHNHLSGFTTEHRAKMEAGQAYGFDATRDVRAFYHAFLDGPAQTQPFWSFIQGWWDVRHLPNVRLLHYEDIVADMPAEIRNLAGFIGAALSEERLEAIMPLCSLEHMRSLGEEDGAFDAIFQQGARTFFNKGVNGRWRDVLTRQEIDKADLLASQNLTPDCAAWLRAGAE